VSRGPQTFRKRDVVAAIRAAVQAGQQVDRIEIHRDGSIIVILAGGKEQSASKPGCDAVSEWDDLK
jgi:hypothetical protein